MIDTGSIKVPVMLTMAAVKEIEVNLSLYGFIYLLTSALRLK